MPPSTIIKPLAKVMIAAAWADGAVTHDEVNSLKDLLFNLPEMTASDWAELEIYIDAPVGEAERERLVAELQQALSKREEKDLALVMIDELVHADGEISQEEREAVEEIKAAIRGANLGLFGQMGNLLKGPLSRRTKALSDAPNRELHLEDYQTNRVFYNLSRRLEVEEADIQIPEPELRKLSLAGGLMARVAYVDHEIADGEFDSMVQAIQEGWDLSKIQAALAAEVAVSTIGKGLDYYRLSREFFLSTSENERTRFLDVLFAVADGDGRVSYEEIEEVRAIANVLKFTHRQFIDAKLKIPRERRAN